MDNIEIINYLTSYQYYIIQSHNAKKLLLQ